VSELRRELIPLEKRYPLPEVMDALRRFDEAGGKRITFEYTMIAGSTTPSSSSIRWPTWPSRSARS
jgi:adenine C2-methylase RlmN of 23S rRNA A2503 and tRNA A37